MAVIGEGIRTDRRADDHRTVHVDNAASRIGRQSHWTSCLPGWQGVGIWIGFQTFFINIGVNLDLPTKGPAAMMSYGGSAGLMNLVALAVVLHRL
jgi:cell division protein FtsW (lipid II flippase)